jgi:sorbose reductase
MVTNGTNETQKSIRAANPPINDSVFKSFCLDSSTVVITSSSGGIGYEAARGLAEARANVHLPLNIRNRI